MCGQVGFIFSTKRRRGMDYLDIQVAFTTLLLLHENRGPHATGVSWLNQSGEHRIVKQALPVSQFIQGDDFRSLIKEVGHGTSWLAGHSRWVTRGTAKNNRNNHPIRCLDVIGTHNGTLVNADALAQQFGLPRQTEVDSEVLVRLVQNAWKPEGLSLSRLKNHLANCKGQLSAVLANKSDPYRVLLIHGNKPLFVRFHAGQLMLAYASYEHFLESLLPEELGWQKWWLPSNHLVLIDTRDMRTQSPVPFKFQALNRMTKMEAVS